MTYMALAAGCFFLAEHVARSFEKNMTRNILQRHNVQVFGRGLQPLVLPTHALQRAFLPLLART